MLQSRGSKLSGRAASPVCGRVFARNPIQTACPTNGIPMKITTWNVNSLNVRLPQDVHTGLPAMLDDPQRRVIAATIGGVRVINVYCVNGEAPDSPKFQYKQQWFAALTEFVRDEMARYEKLVLLGDFNIAPTDDDCYDAEKWRGKILCTDSERGWFKNLLDLGLTDSLRQIHPEGAFYTWFDYRGAMFQRGLGLRIDHLLVSPALSAVLKDVQVDSDARAQERPSDHAPVWAEFDL